MVPRVLTATGRTAVYLTTGDVAERLRCSTHTLRYWRHRGEGPPSVKLAGLVRYRLADLEAWENEAS